MSLLIITGPTASGKTRRAVDCARALNGEIISADSRQIYQGLPIGTAAPSAEQLARVRHHFVASLPLDAYYSAAQFES
ncbi:MAG: tRNA (adenosine(37)-N6)-dimethylallyltransferase MiaA, partial [Barnesiella sp.]|nr:tRNA (adenosine(37)-N6)-dimethylallyltransferase MiaA [Barnesiella sp.]